MSIAPGHADQLGCVPVSAQRRTGLLQPRASGGSHREQARIGRDRAISESEKSSATGTASRLRVAETQEDPPSESVESLKSLGLETRRLWNASAASRTGMPQDDGRHMLYHTYPRDMSGGP